jgi:hypothetical protein
MCVQRDIESRSRNHCCRGKAASIKYSKGVCLYSCLSFPACYAHAPYCVVLGELSGCTMFFCVMSQTVRLCVLIFVYDLCLKHFSFCVLFREIYPSVCSPVVPPVTGSPFSVHSHSRLGVSMLASGHVRGTVRSQTDAFK